MKNQPSQKGCLASAAGFITLALIIILPKLLIAMNSLSRQSQMNNAVNELVNGPAVQEVIVARPYVTGIGVANEPIPISVDFIGTKMCTECPGWNEELRNSAIAEVAKLTEDKTIRIEFDAQRTRVNGNWPDVLAYVWADDILLNVEMVRRGYLAVGDFGVNTKYMDKILGAERDAKTAKVGIWAQTSFIPTP